MPVKVCSGDLFTDPAEVWVNAVNCIGPMGAGIAKQFRNRFPNYYADYCEKCRLGQIEIGRVEPYALPMAGSAPPPLFIVSFPTMFDPGEATREDTLDKGLRSLVDFSRSFGMTELAVPALGCGIGDFSFDALLPMVEEAFKHDPVGVNLYRPISWRELEALRQT